MHGILMAATYLATLLTASFESLFDLTLGACDE